MIASSTLPANPLSARLAFPEAATTIVSPAGATPVPAKFVANRPGTSFILCRIGKHAQNSMYVEMQVINGAKTMAYE